MNQQFLSWVGNWPSRVGFQIKVTGNNWTYTMDMSCFRYLDVEIMFNVRSGYLKDNILSCNFLSASTFKADLNLTNSLKMFGCQMKVDLYCDLIHVSFAYASIKSGFQSADLKFESSVWLPKEQTCFRMHHMITLHVIFGFFPNRNLTTENN